MQNQSVKKNIQSAPRQVGQALMCLFLVLFILFEVFLVSVMVVRAFPSSADHPDRLPQIGGSNGNQPPTSVNAIFSGGQMPSLPNGTGAALGAEISSQYALLIDAETGAILASKNESAQFDPASMAKVMAMVVLCERLSLDDLNREIEMTADLTEYVTTGLYAGAEASLIKMKDGVNLFAGDTFPIRELLYGVGVASAADCTMMLVQDVCPAATIAESERAFVALMNQKAQSLGLTATVFDNAVGLEGASTKSSARDMAILLSYALQCDLIQSALSVNPEHVFTNDWIDNGETKTYNIYLKSTLFYRRMNSYQNQYKKNFSLTTATLNGGKTGWLTDDTEKLTGTSTLACWLTGKSTGKRYILVTAGCSETYLTMKDVKTIADTYIP